MALFREALVHRFFMGWITNNVCRITIWMADIASSPPMIHYSEMEHKAGMGSFLQNIVRQDVRGS